MQIVVYMFNSTVVLSTSVCVKVLRLYIDPTES